MSKRHSLMQCNGVVLAAYPSCEDCLAWSDDGLAVAGGQNVYILRNASDASQNVSQGSANWSTSAVRVDQFSHHEWPERKLATLPHLSIGEEQSQSVVVGLSWSPPGLGIHRRCVLAVLTSNLILSIWETDGSQRGWQRTCVVNQHLPAYASTENIENEIGRARRRLRIRAFAWSDPLLASPDARWGKHHLAVADDDNNLTFFSISKTGNEGHGKWLLIPICTSFVSSSASQPKSSRRMTNLQRSITERSPTKRIVINSWQTEYESAPTGRTQCRARSLISCVRSSGHEMPELSVEISYTQEGVTGSIFPSSSLHVQDGRCRTHNKEGVYKRLQASEIVHSATEKPEWHEALEQVCTDFDRQNCLNGLFRVRFWGSAKSPDNQTEAACVTLHPWDTYEYTSPVHEKSRVVLRSLGTPTGRTDGLRKSEDEVLASISEFVVQSLDSCDGLMSKLDCKLLRAFIAWTSLHPERVKTYHRLQEKITQQRSDQADAAKVPDDVQAIRAQMSNRLDAADACDLCGSQIPITATNLTAVCESGHPFTRCSLSLLSIQEPGISKHCALCERQFLDSSKLGPHDSQSLFGRLFDAFDTCPYCGGKYCS